MFLSFNNYVLLRYIQLHFGYIIAIAFLGERVANWACHLVIFWLGVVGSGKGVVYLTSPGRPTDIGLQLGKTCYPCSR